MKVTRLARWRLFDCASSWAFRLLEMCTENPLARWNLVAVLALAACTPSQMPNASAPVAARREVPVWRRSCTEYARAPVRVDYQDAPGGAAVIYRTKGDVAALLRRTREIGQFHNSSRSKLGALHDLSSIPHRAYVEPLKDGARLVLVSKGPPRQRTDALRMQVQQEVFNLQRRGCGTGQEAL